MGIIHQIARGPKLTLELVLAREEKRSADPTWGSIGANEIAFDAFSGLQLGGKP